MKRHVCITTTIMVALVLGALSASAQPAEQPVRQTRVDNAPAQGFSAGELAELQQLEQDHALERDVVGGQWAETDVAVWVAGAVAITALFLVLY